MRRFRFNIASLLVVVLLVAVGFAALRESNETWDSGLFTLTHSVLLASTLLAIHRIDARRAFWIGFAVFGSGYLALSLVPSIKYRLVTTLALGLLDSKIAGRPRLIYTNDTSPTNEGNQLAPSSQGQVRGWQVARGRLLGVWRGTTENLLGIGHSLFALLAGWAGGLLSRRLWRTSRRAHESAAITFEVTTQ
jgi:hypothetical protein